MLTLLKDLKDWLQCTCKLFRVYDLLPACYEYLYHSYSAVSLCNDVNSYLDATILNM